jgi:steroid delta-isomerase-like uncharacterized protein
LQHGAALALETRAKEEGMSEQENLQIMREFFEAAKAHDVERIAAFVDEGFVLESDAQPAPVIGRQKYRDLLVEWYSSFPDAHYEIKQMISSGDTVAIRLRLSGTHRGEFMGKPGSGRRFEYHLCRFDQLRNAKVVHTWAYYDASYFLRQLGLAQT